MRGFKKNSYHSSAIGILLFLVFFGSYGLVFVPEAGIYRSLIVLFVFFMSLCALTMSMHCLLASALLIIYQSLVLFSVALYLFFSFLNAYAVEISRILLWISASIWVSLLWINVPGLLEWLKRSLYFLTVITFFLVIYFAGELEGYTSTSRNYWSLFLVPILGSFFLLKYIRSERVCVFLCFLVFLVAVLTQGRSEIVSSGLIFLAAVLYNFRFMNSLIKRLFVSIALMVVSLAVVFYALVNGLFDYALAKGFGDQVRSNIISEYVFHIDDFVSLVSGVAVYLIESAREFNYNLHNTFLYFHSRFGVYFFVIMFLIVFALIRSLLSCSWAAFLVIFAVLIRFSTDSGWGINSLAIHLLCIFGLDWIMSSFRQAVSRVNLNQGGA